MKNFKYDWLMDGKTYNVEISFKGDIWFIRNIQVYRNTNRFHRLVNKMFPSLNICLRNLPISEKIHLINKLSKNSVFNLFISFIIIRRYAKKALQR